MGFMAEFMGNEWKWWLDVWKQFQEIINIPILTMWIHFLALFWSYRLDVWLPELRAILEPQIGTLKMPAMASPVNASMPRGLDYEEQYEMLVKYKTRLFRTEQVLLPCGTNVGPMWVGMFSRMFSHTSELAHLAHGWFSIIARCRCLWLDYQIAWCSEKGGSLMTRAQWWTALSNLPFLSLFFLVNGGIQILFFNLWRNHAMPRQRQEDAWECEADRTPLASKAGGSFRKAAGSAGFLFHELNARILFKPYHGFFWNHFYHILFTCNGLNLNYHFWYHFFSAKSVQFPLLLAVSWAFASLAPLLERKIFIHTGLA